MIVNPLAFRVNDFVLRIAVLELSTVLLGMRVHAAVTEGALALPFVEQAARDLLQRRLVVINKSILVAAHAMIVRRYD